MGRRRCEPDDMQSPAGPSPLPEGRDVFPFMINGAKVRAFAAIALFERLGAA